MSINIICIIICQATVFITYWATLGCVPVVTVLRTVRGTCQPPARLTMLFRHVPKLCGLRFTKRLIIVITHDIIKQATVFTTYRTTLGCVPAIISVRTLLVT